MINKSKEYSIECSLNLHKRTFGVKFKNRVSKAVQEIRKVSCKLMGVKTVRIDPLFNMILCKNGSKRVPHRVRVRLSKRRFLINGDIENWMVYVSFVENKHDKNNSQSSFIKIA